MRGPSRTLEQMIRHSMHAKSLCETASVPVRPLATQQFLQPILEALRSSVAGTSNLLAYCSRLSSTLAAGVSTSSLSIRSAAAHSEGTSRASSTHDPNSTSSIATDDRFNSSSTSSSSQAAQHQHSNTSQHPEHPAAPSSSSNRPPSRPHSSLDKREAAKFAALADQWWDKTKGPFAPLHALNPARCQFLRQGVCSVRGLDHLTGEPLLGLTALDVGCGGGLLTEPVARMGAEVHGIDVSDEVVAAAAAHATGDPLLEQRVRYQMTTLEELVSSSVSYDIVMASEVIEHVRKPRTFLADLAAVTQPGGQVIITTINRTPASYAVAILAAEYVTGVVPRGTHDWSKFVTPQELAMMAADAGLKVELVAGMQLDFPSGQFKLGQDPSVNYAALLSKPR